MTESLNDVIRKARGKEWRQDTESHAQRDKVLVFLSSSVKLLPWPRNGVIKDEWMEKLDLPQDVRGGEVVGQLLNFPFRSKLTPILRRRNYEKTNVSLQYARKRELGNWVVLTYDVAPVMRSICCRLRYLGPDWEHGFWIPFAKNYRGLQYGIDSLEQLDKVLTNHGQVLDVIERELLNGLDETYSSSGS